MSDLKVRPPSPPDANTPAMVILQGAVVVRDRYQKKGLARGEAQYSMQKLY